MNNTSIPALELTNIFKRYQEGDGWLNVLTGASLTIYPGQIVALVGPSGAGKSTLLHIAGLLDHPDRGAVKIAGEQVTDMSDSGRSLLRRSKVSFVYQFHHLLPEFTAEENIIIPQTLAGIPHNIAKDKAQKLLKSLGIGERSRHFPSQLSGGEQQRVAICRAIANFPNLLLADEPTGNLDPNTSELVFAQLIQLARHLGVAAFIATHNLALAKRMDRVIIMEQGKLQEISPQDLKT